MAAELTEKWVKKTWARTSSTGKALASQVKDYEKAIRSNKGARRDGSLVTGNLKTLQRTLEQAEKDYAKKKDKKMLKASSDLLTLVEDALEDAETSLFDAKQALADWIRRREDVKRLTATFVDDLDDVIDTSNGLVRTVQDLERQASEVAPASDPASVKSIKGTVNTCAEDAETILRVAEARWAKLQNGQLGAVRQETPESVGLSAEDTRGVEKLWHECTALFGEAEEQLAVLRSNSTEINSMLRSVKALLSEGADRLAGVKDLIDTAVADARKTIEGAGRLESSLEGITLRLGGEVLTEHIPRAVREKDRSALDGVLKSVTLRRSDTAKRRPGVERDLDAAEAMLDRNVARVPRDLWRSDALVESRDAVERLRKEIDRLRGRIDQLVDELEDRLVEVESAVEQARAKIG